MAQVHLRHLTEVGREWVIVSTQVRSISVFPPERLNNFPIYTKELHKGHFLPVLAEQRFKVELSTRNMSAVITICRLGGQPPENDSIIKICDTLQFVHASTDPRADASFQEQLSSGHLQSSQK